MGNTTSTDGTRRIPDWTSDEGREKPTPVYGKDDPEKKNPIRLPPTRRVEIGMNVIAIHDINDAEHYFECNMLLHIFWNACPLKYQPGGAVGPAFAPWIQLHNLRNMVYEVTTNRGMIPLSKEELDDVVKKFYANPDNANKPCMVRETRNYVAQFLNELDLHAFPFDSQLLRITIVCNDTKEVTLTHKINRKTDAGRIHWYVPEDNFKLRIKCNLEGSTISEWRVLMDDNYTGIDMKKNSVPAVSSYYFREHDPKWSAENAIYQRMDFHIIAHRQINNFLWSVIMPTTLLCASSLSVFAMEIVDNIGNRLSILFTIVLAIIANSIATQDRLPRVDYFTWADYCLNSLMIYVYLVVIQTSICEKLADYLNTDPDSLDTVFFWIFLGGLCLLLVIGTASGLALHHERAMVGEVEKIKAQRCFWVEEDRLYEVETGIRRRTNPEGAHDQHYPEMNNTDNQIAVHLPHESH